MGIPERGTIPAMAVKELYDRDFFLWTVRNAELLRAGRLDEADLQHIAEEIEDMGKREQRELESRLIVLLVHLLKGRVQPNRRGASWMGTIKIQRDEIARLLKKMPTLCNALAEEVPEAYRSAVLRAAIQTGLAESSFPETCPFGLEQILDREFLPA